MAGRTSGPQITFLYQLAERLGKSVAEILQTFPIHEIEGWKAYLMKESNAAES